MNGLYALITDLSECMHTLQRSWPSSALGLHVGHRAARAGLRTDGGRRKDLAHMCQGFLKVLLLHRI